LGSAVGSDPRAAAPRRGPWRGRQRWLPWLAAALAWAVALGLGWLLIHGALAHPPHMVDLGVYRTAGRQVLNGRPVYAQIPAGMLRSLGRSYLVFTYPPFAAIVAVPLALLSWHLAQLAWVPVVYVPLAVLIWFAFRPLLSRARRYAPAAFGVIFIICMYLWPVLQQIRFGQVDIALAALCVADVASRNPRWPRGLLIGLATAIKLTPGVFIIYLLLTGRRRAAIVSAASAACFSLVAWLAAPGSSSYYWTSALLNVNRLGRPEQIADQSIRAMLLRAFAPGQVPVALWLALVLAVAVAGFAAARRAALRGHEIAGVAIVGMLAVLISPVSWIHHIVWVIPAIGAILDDGRRTWRWLAAAASTEFFVLADPHALTTTRPWFGRFAPHLTAQLAGDAYGLACAAVIVILAVLPKAAAPAAPGPDRQEKQPPPPPARAPGYSTAPGGSEPAGLRQLVPRAHPPDAP
jgi:alpha-1,2-mannosyltransferase